MAFLSKQDETHSQILDSLTSHIALYHSHSRTPTPISNPRSSILKWLSSLPPHRRLPHLTALDPLFVRVLSHMFSTRLTRGPGLFILLPDLPSGDLPSVCFKSSRGGLLARAALADAPARALFDSARLFSSQDGLDSVTVSEELAGDLDRFVGVMDGLSGGGFLRGGEESELGAEWVELGWLKEKGYYSIEAFLANRLEVALRLAWLNHGAVSGKKRGAKLREKLTAAGLAANVYWRNKGCVDWWEGLDSVVKAKVFNSVLAKSATHLVICEF